MAQDNFFPDTKGKSESFKALVRYIRRHESFCSMPNSELFELMRFILREIEARIRRKR